MVHIWGCTSALGPDSLEKTTIGSKVGNMFDKKLRRLLPAVGLLVAAMAAPAAATPHDGGGEHKVTICHVTNSATNPYVVITVDVAAFDGQGANDHTHHASKDGRVDVVFADGECRDDTPGPSL